jgi:chromosome partitioning protein
LQRLAAVEVLAFHVKLPPQVFAKQSASTQATDCRCFTWNITPFLTVRWRVLLCKPEPTPASLRFSGRVRQMSKVIAIANQKGGVGKTTTAINLGACLAVAERPTLVIDADPQGNATSGLGIDRDALDVSIYDLLLEGARAEDAVLSGVHFPKLDVLPSHRDLLGAEVAMAARPGRETLLRDAMASIRPRYDYIIIDSPPSLGLLTVNTLAAADAVLIPIQCEYYALEGLSQLLNTVRLVQRALNPSLLIEGVLLTMFNERLNLSRQVADEARDYFGPKVYRTAIPRNIRLAEAPSFGKPIVVYDVLSSGAASYLDLAQELMSRNGSGKTTAEATR